MGDDWAGQFDELEQLTDAQVIYLPRTPEISTTFSCKKNRHTKISI
ncbi:hypothetical protein EfmAA290_08810 [Enterococcus faecium]|nr:hypothetical protein EfmAA290_08810 [Enterococcus faecium]